MNEPKSKEFKRRLSHKILLLLMSLITTLFIVEIASRFYYYGSLKTRYSTPDGEFVRYDEQLGWSMIPNSEGFFSNPREGYNGHVKFDEHGMRVNDNIVTSKTKAVLVIGDSTTAGMEVDNDETYVAVLERLFLDNHCDYRFYNAGVRGYGTDQSLWRFEQLVDVVKPDYVIYMFSSNDFTDNRTIKRANRKYSKPIFLFEKNKVDIINRPAQKFPHPYYSFVQYSASGYIINKGYKEKKIPPISEFLRNNFAIYYPLRAIYKAFPVAAKSHIEKGMGTQDLAILEFILSKINEHNVKLFFTSFPHDGSQLYIIAFKELSNRMNISYLDISAYFNEKSENYHWRSDRHWNEKGHLQAATALFDMLQPQLCED